MNAFLSAVKSHRGQRIFEISLIVLVLLVVFSVGGVPMILLSTFTPSWSHGEPEQQKYDGYDLDGLGASDAV